MPKAPKASTAKARAEPYDASSRATDTASNAEAATEPDAGSYLLQVGLLSTENPCITRLLSVPSNYTFRDLHQVLQIAFGWASSHAYSFSVTELSGADDRLRKMTGRGKPVLSLMMDDNMKHHYPDPEQMKKDADYKLADIYDGEHKGKVEVTYEYDFGDGWEHKIVFLGRADPTLKNAMLVPEDIQVFCLGGEGHRCAEDCGGPPGWEDLKDLFVHKRKKDPDERREWYTEVCANKDRKGLDPWRWSILDVNHRLSKFKV